MILNQSVVLTVQISLMLIVALAVFQLPLNGSVFLVFLFAFVLGIAGMMLGILISSISRNESESVQTTLGCFFPILLLSGIIWPISAVPKPLIYVSYALPSTWAAEALRSIFGRGWSMLNAEVSTAFIIVCCWSVVLFLISMRTMRNQD